MGLGPLPLHYHSTNVCPRAKARGTGDLSRMAAVGALRTGGRSTAGARRVSCFLKSSHSNHITPRSVPRPWVPTLQLQPVAGTLQRAAIQHRRVRARICAGDAIDAMTVLSKHGRTAR